MVRYERGYGRRKRGTRETRRVFVIVCEGDKTEPTYFNRYKKWGCNLTIVTPKNKHTDPIGLVEEAKGIIKKGKTGENVKFNFKNGDKIWCAFDCDENTNEIISKACKIAGKDIIMCYSNPCIELWFLLHFTPILSKLSHTEAKARLKKYIPDYHESKDVYDLLIEKRPVAIKNAKNLNKTHEKIGTELICVESNPSTQVFAIVEEILKITER